MKVNRSSWYKLLCWALSYLLLMGPVISSADPGDPDPENREVKIQELTEFIENFDLLGINPSPELINELKQKVNNWRENSETSPFTTPELNLLEETLNFFSRALVPTQGYRREFSNFLEELAEGIIDPEKAEAARERFRSWIRDPHRFDMPFRTTFGSERPEWLNFLHTHIPPLLDTTEDPELRRMIAETMINRNTRDRSREERDDFWDQEIVESILTEDFGDDTWRIHQAAFDSIDLSRPETLQTISSVLTSTGLDGSFAPELSDDVVSILAGRMGTNEDSGTRSFAPYLQIAEAVNLSRNPNDRSLGVNMGYSNLAASIPAGTFSTSALAIDTISQLLTDPEQDPRVHQVIAEQFLNFEWDNPETDQGLYRQSPDEEDVLSEEERHTLRGTVAARLGDYLSRAASGDQLDHVANAAKAIAKLGHESLYAEFANTEWGISDAPETLISALNKARDNGHAEAEREVARALAAIGTNPFPREAGRFLLPGIEGDLSLESYEQSEEALGFQRASSNSRMLALDAAMRTSNGEFAADFTNNALATVRQLTSQKDNLSDESFQSQIQRELVEEQIYGKFEEDEEGNPQMVAPGFHQLYLSLVADHTAPAETQNQSRRYFTEQGSEGVGFLSSALTGMLLGALEGDSPTACTEGFAENLATQLAALGEHEEVGEHVANTLVSAIVRAENLKEKVDEQCVTRLGELQDRIALDEGLADRHLSPENHTKFLTSLRNAIGAEMLPAERLDNWFLGNTLITDVPGRTCLTSLPIIQSSRCEVAPEPILRDAWPVRELAFTLSLDTAPENLRRYYEYNLVMEELAGILETGNALRNLIPDDEYERISQNDDDPSQKHLIRVPSVCLADEEDVPAHSFLYRGLVRDLQDKLGEYNTNRDNNPADPALQQEREETLRQMREASREIATIACRNPNTGFRQSLIKYLKERYPILATGAVNSRALREGIDNFCREDNPDFSDFVRNMYENRRHLDNSHTQSYLVNDMAEVASILNRYPEASRIIAPRLGERVTDDFLKDPHAPKLLEELATMSDSEFEEKSGEILVQQAIFGLDLQRRMLKEICSADGDEPIIQLAHSHGTRARLLQSYGGEEGQAAAQADCLYQNWIANHLEDEEAEKLRWQAGMIAAGAVAGLVALPLLPMLWGASIVGATTAIVLEGTAIGLGTLSGFINYGLNREGEEDALDQIEAYLIPEYGLNGTWRGSSMPPEGYLAGLESAKHFNSASALTWEIVGGAATLVGLGSMRNLLRMRRAERLLASLPNRGRLPNIRAIDDATNALLRMGESPGEIRRLIRGWDQPLTATQRATAIQGLRRLGYSQWLAGRMARNLTEGHLSAIRTATQSLRTARAPASTGTRLFGTTGQSARALFDRIKNLFNVRRALALGWRALKAPVVLPARGIGWVIGKTWGRWRRSAHMRAIESLIGTGNRPFWSSTSARRTVQYIVRGGDLPGNVAHYFRALNLRSALKTMREGFEHLGHLTETAPVRSLKAPFRAVTGNLFRNTNIRDALRYRMAVEKVVEAFLANPANTRLFQALAREVRRGGFISPSRLRAIISQATQKGMLLTPGLQRLSRWSQTAGYLRSVGRVGKGALAWGTVTVLGVRYDLVHDLIPDLKERYEDTKSMLTRTLRFWLDRPTVPLTSYSPTTTRSIEDLTTEDPTNFSDEEYSNELARLRVSFKRYITENIMIPDDAFRELVELGSQIRGVVDEISTDNPDDDRLPNLIFRRAAIDEMVRDSLRANLFASKTAQHVQETFNRYIGVNIRPDFNLIERKLSQPDTPEEVKEALRENRREWWNRRFRGNMESNSVSAGPGETTNNLYIFGITDETLSEMDQRIGSQDTPQETKQTLINIRDEWTNRAFREEIRNEGISDGRLQRIFQDLYRVGADPRSRRTIRRLPQTTKRRLKEYAISDSFSQWQGEIDQQNATDEVRNLRRRLLEDIQFIITIPSQESGE
ncbi:hypothetical protein ACFLRA_02805 [Bdellovibrionota bacterium]